MDSKPLIFDERVIEIIPPDKSQCAGPEVARCDAAGQTASAQQSSRTPCRGEDR